MEGLIDWHSVHYVRGSFDMGHVWRIYDQEWQIISVHFLLVGLHVHHPWLLDFVVAFFSALESKTRILCGDREGRAYL